MIYYKNATMLSSIRTLFQAPYNKKKPVFALRRFFYWKAIRVLKIRDRRYALWGDRALLLNYDSLQSMWIMYNYWVDWEEFNLISRYVRPGDVVFDIGTNMGFYTIWMSRFVGAHGRIHSFEPDQRNFGRLQANIGINKMGDRIRANNFAVSDIDGELRFTTGLDGENHISRSGEENVVTIPAKKLDSYVQEQGVDRIAYMKIDVEGFEYTVLKGADRLLSAKKIDILQLEINITLRHSNVTVDDLLQLLKRYGYTLCLFDVQNGVLMPVDYTKERENYFAVFDLHKANDRLRARD